MTSDSRLLGRGHELDAARGLLARARKGAGDVLLIKGGAGMGKTRLIQAIVDEAADFVVHRGTAEELDAERPFGLIADALGLSEEPPESPRGILLSLIKGGGGGQHAQPQADLRFAIVEETVSLLESESLDDPVLLVLDDMHWADASSVIAAQRLARQVPQRRIAVICTYRPTPRSDALEAFIGGRLAAGQLELTLEPLSPEEVEELVISQFDAAPGPNLIRHLEGAGGNPLFVQELLAAVTPDQVTYLDDRIDVRRTSAAPSVHLAVLRRLRFLGQDTLHLLQVAAVLGESFSLDALAASTGSTPLDSFSQLREAIDAGFIAEAGDRLRFSHDVVREALYADLPLSAQRALHLQVARALADAGGSHLDVAQHFCLGAQPGDEQAIAWLHEAAKEASPRAPSVAVNLYERALELVGANDERRASLQMEMLRPLLLAGDTDKIVPVAEAVMKSDPSWEAESMARSTLYGHHLIHDRLADAITEIDTLLARDDLPDFQRAHFSALGASRALLGDVRAGVDMAREAIELGEASGASYAVANGNLTLATVASINGDLDRAMEHARTAKDVMRSPGRAQPVRVGTLEMDRANVSLFGSASLLASDEFDLAREGYTAARAGFESMGAAPFVAWTHWAMANLHFHAGRWDEALAELEASDLLGTDGGRRPRPNFGDPLPEIYLHRGDLSAAQDALEMALDTPPLSPGGWWVTRIRAVIAEARGQETEALDILRGAWDASMSLGALPELRAIGGPSARLALKLHDEDLVRSLRETATQVMGAPKGPSSRAAAARLCLGLLEGEEAILQEAVSEARSSPRPLLLAECLEAWAGSLPSDQTEGVVSALVEANEIYDTLGAEWDVGRIGASLRQFGVRKGARGTRGRPKTGWESLTPAELQVVELLTEGLSNPQIGERLFISRRTVASHLSSAFRKLGVVSRAELAAVAARQGASSVT